MKMSAVIFFECVLPEKNMNWLMATKTGTIMNFNYFQTMENVTYYHPEHGVFTWNKRENSCVHKFFVASARLDLFSAINHVQM